MASTNRGSRGRREDDGARIAPFAAYRFKNREVLTSSGQPGKVTNVLLGDDGQYYAVVDFGPELGSHQVPISSVAYEGNHFVVREADVRALPSFVEGQAGLRSIGPDAAISIAGYKVTDSDDSTILVQNASPQVTVQRPALLINWEQAPPQITVHQPTPHVNVRQLQPIIIVRQPPPKVTVEFEQPEIIVRMPDPQVDVSIAEPEVQISMPKPHVEVVQPEQPQVRISAGEPLVSLVPRHAAEVALERSQPQVRFERIGEPQISFRELNGGPRVRFEQLSSDEALRLETLAPKSDARTLTAIQLQGLKVYSRDGDEIGTVHRIVVGEFGKLAVLMETGGFLGFAARRIVLPVSSFTIRGDQLFIRDMNAADIGKLETRAEDLGRHTAVDDDRQVQFVLAR